MISTVYSDPQAALRRYDAMVRHELRPSRRARVPERAWLALWIRLCVVATMHGRSALVVGAALDVLERRQEAANAEARIVAGLHRLFGRWRR